MNIVRIIICIAVGVALHFLIIKSIEVRNARKWCKEHNLIHDKNEGNV